MPAVSQKQQKFFGYLKGHPEEASKRGISEKTVEEFAKTKRKGLPVSVRHAARKAHATPRHKPMHNADAAKAAAERFGHGAGKRA